MSNKYHQKIERLRELAAAEERPVTLMESRAERLREEGGLARDGERRETEISTSFAYQWRVTGSDLDTLAKNIYLIFGGMVRSPEEIESLRAQFGDRVKIWEPETEEDRRLCAMTVQDWRNAIMRDVMELPHEVAFNLDDFDLGAWREKIEASPDHVYNPEYREPGEKRRRLTGGKK